MNDLSFAAKVAQEFPKIKDNPAIVQAIKILEELAGESGTIQKAMTSGSMQAIKGKKDVGTSTVRGLSGNKRELEEASGFEERLTKETIYKIVQQAIKG